MTTKLFIYSKDGTPVEEILILAEFPFHSQVPHTTRCEMFIKRLEPNKPQSRIPTNECTYLGDWAYLGGNPLGG